MSGSGALAVLGLAAVALSGVTCAVVILRFGRQMPVTHRIVARLFGVGLLTWALGAALAVAHHVTDDVTVARASSATFLLTSLTHITAVLLHPALGSRVVRIRVLANAVIVGCSALTLLWYAAGRHLVDAGADLPSALGALAYPASDVTTISLVLAVTIRSGRDPSRTGARVHASSVAVLAGFVVVLVGDLVHLLGAAHGPTSGIPLVTETCWILAFALLARSVRLARGERTSTSRRDDRRLSAALGTAPVLAAVGAGVAAAADWAVRGTVDPFGMLMLTLVVSMVLGRQSLTVSDNRKLGHSLERIVADLEHQATHDTLTGLPNRSGLLERIRAALEASEAAGRRAGLMFVDLDHLKPVNDSLGHAAGDLLLQTTAARISARVGPTLTRFGGDEFVVVLDDLPAADPVASAELIGRQVVADTGEPVEIEGHLIRPSVSAGIAIAGPGMAPEELMRRADLALYRAKARGRRRVATYDPLTEPDARRRIDLEYELRRAIRHDEFEVHYQPVVELATGRIVGVESLLRWRHPERGLLMPGAFLDEAAGSGLLGNIGEHTLMRVCSDLALLTGPEGQPAPTVAVNLSTTELTDSRLRQRVRTALETYGMEPSRLCIEITEDVIVDDEIRSSIDALRAMGVHLAIDDFGTGNSSLRQLGTYPAEILKIDRSFIAPLGHDEQHTAIVRAILGLARNLGLRTVAEGVEHEEQAELLRELGCDHAQGWLFAPALTLEELEEHLGGARPSHFRQLSALDRRELRGRGAPASLPLRS
jgi:diguanylate cyclase (GGDEF)-like protein